MEYQMNEINFLISVAWAEHELLHSTSLSLALGRPPLYLRSLDIPSVETQSVLSSILAFRIDF